MERGQTFEKRKKRNAGRKIKIETAEFERFVCKFLSCYPHTTLSKGNLVVLQILEIFLSFHPIQLCPIKKYERSVLLK
jgi:hypothetical protein